MIRDRRRALDHISLTATLIYTHVSNRASEKAVTQSRRCPLTPFTLCDRFVPFLSPSIPRGWSSRRAEPPSRKRFA